MKALQVRTELDVSQTASERIVLLLNAHPVREGVFRAKCPAHDGLSNRSLSIKVIDDRVLMHCHGGCSIQSVLQAIGIRSISELFEAPLSRPDPEMQKQLRIRRGLETWGRHRLTLVCRELRDLDEQIGIASNFLSRCENGGTSCDSASKDQLWEILGNAYRMRSNYEQEFEILQYGDLQTKYSLFRTLK